MKLYRKIYDKFIHWLTLEPAPTEIPPCDFNRLKHEIRPGDVLLIEGRSRVSNIIRSVTQSPWTHAALYIGRAEDIEDPAIAELVEKNIPKEKNVRLIIEGLLGKGTIVSSLSNYRDQHIRICRPIGLSQHDTELVIAYAIKALGKPYSVHHLLDLARFLLPWTLLPRRWGSSLFKTPSGHPEGGICSSLIAEAFTSVEFPILPYVKIHEETGMELVHRNPYIFTPKDFDYSPYFEIIKYPFFTLEEQLPYYRRLPWTKDGTMHQDHGEFVQPQTKKPKKERFFARKTDDAKPSDMPPEQQPPVEESIVLIPGKEVPN
jgi:hypothetical protein